MSLQQAINEICDQIKHETLSEAQVSQCAVLPVLYELGWPKFKPNIVTPQYSLGEKSQNYVDYALCHPEKKEPLVYIEVKNSTIRVEKAEEQLFRYAFEKGVRLAILTNGHNWKFYYPPGRGTPSERCFYDLNICENDFKESSSRLNRYLRYKDIVTEKAFDVIREDYNQAYTNRKIEKTLPDAWQEIVNGPLIDLLTETVERMCTYRPNKSKIQSFLKGLSVPAPSYHTPSSQGTTLVSSTEAPGFVLNGVRHDAKSGIAILVGVLNELIRINPSFAEQFTKSDFNRYKDKYKYLSENRNDLQNPKPVRQLDSGWWINDGLNRERIDRIIQEACKITGVEYGIELILHYPPEKKRSQAVNETASESLS